MSVRDLTRYDKFRAREFDDIETFLRSRIPTGVATIKYNGGLLDLLVRRHAGATTTIVVFHAAVKRAATRPVFNGLGVTNGLPANLILVSDPTLEFSDDLTLAWFAGNRRQRLQRDLTRMFRRIFNKLKTPHKVFFGGSGGGFASLYYASRFPGSIAIACNPQTSIGKFWPAAVNRYVGAAFGTDGGLAASLARLDAGGVSHDLCSRYQLDRGNAVAYLQNIPDVRHVRGHLLPFYDSVTTRMPVGYLMGEWGPGHYPPPKETLVSVLEGAVAVEGQWSQLLAAEGFSREIPVDDLSAMTISEKDSEAGWIVV